MLDVPGAAQEDGAMRDDIFDMGLQFDVSTLLRRRRLLGLFAGTGLAALVGCSSAPSPSPSSSPGAGSCAQIPEETAGPYPGDGSNGANVLTRSGIVRGDIRSSLGPASGVAQGVPLTIVLTLRETSNGCAPLSGAAVYVWHCDREGNYSMYSQPAVNENYLRGVQASDRAGMATFTSIFPGCYSGRWPHIHFEVYPGLAKATDSANVVATSQLALPAGVCQTVYGTDGYGDSIRNLRRVSLKSDTVFRDDGGVRQLATVTGSVSSGLTVALTVPV
jgi:protocatechuate 3,4-dioxygenase beta subunit